MNNREEIVSDVVRLLIEKKNIYGIRNFLTKEGINQNDFDSIIEEAKVIHRNKSTVVRRVIWISLTVFTFVLFYFLIPTSFYNAGPMVVSFFGAILFTVFLAQSIGDFRSWDEFNTKDSENESWQKKMMPFLILPGVLMILVFYMHFSSQEKSELKDSGIKVKGIVIDGTALESRRGGSYTITVKFKTKDGKVFVITENVSESEFSSFYKNQVVDLIYSKNDPQIIELLTSNEAIKDFTESEERDIEIKDMLELLLSNNKRASLNKISYGWEYDNENSGWINRNESIILELYVDKLVAVAMGSEFDDYPEQLEELGIKEKKDKVVNETSFSARYFYSDKYTVVYKVDLGQLGVKMYTTLLIQKIPDK